MLTLREQSLNMALNSINKYGDTYIFPLPHEFMAINEYWEDVREYIKSKDVLKNGLRDFRRCITPKSNLGFRISTQLDPLDSIITTAIIMEIAEDIENFRLPKELEIVYSFRLDPKSDGTLYDKDYKWETFIEKSGEIVDSEEFGYVVITDIADFFASIYLHNIETQLHEAVKKSGKSSHVQTLINAVKAMHINQTHRGIPIGPQFARPIAELILDVVDRVLLDNKIKFIRYVDDYRIFCKSEAEAYDNLTFLAQRLYDLLNLKLNEYKTSILNIDDFKQKHLRTSKKKTSDNIIDEFYELIGELDINTYEEDIDLESLDPDDLEKLHEINLVKLLNDELTLEKPDLGFISFLLRNLASIDNTEVAEIILDKENTKKLYPILNNIISYLERVRSFNHTQKHEIGKQVLELMQETFIGQLDINRAWILSLFTKDDEWDNEEQFTKFLKIYNDKFTTRKLYMALGRSNNTRYFRENKNLDIALDPWQRRAFIAAISCLPEKERDPWFKARQLRERDYLDQIVEKWAKHNHF